MKCKKINPAELLPGDSVFISVANNPQKMGHVMIYSNGDFLIEAPQTNDVIHKISFQERIGLTLTELTNGTVIKNNSSVFFGRYLE